MYIPNDISKGSSGQEVVLLQKFLRFTMQYDIEVDGQFGPDTEKAVLSFQQDSGLPINGIIDTANWVEMLKTAPDFLNSYVPQIEQSTIRAIKSYAPAISIQQSSSKPIVDTSKYYVFAGIAIVVLGFILITSKD